MKNAHLHRRTTRNPLEGNHLEWPEVFVTIKAESRLTTPTHHTIDITTITAVMSLTASIYQKLSRKNLYGTTEVDRL